MNIKMGKLHLCINDIGILPIRFRMCLENEKLNSNFLASFIKV